jgi:hypothetical protein
MIEALNKMLVKPSAKLDTAGVQMIVSALSDMSY